MSLTRTGQSQRKAAARMAALVLYRLARAL